MDSNNLRINVSGGGQKLRNLWPSLLAGEFIIYSIKR